MNHEIEQLGRQAEAELQKCKSETTAEGAQKFVQNLSQILIEMAEVQKKIGAIRKDGISHVGNLRKAKPSNKKVTPEDGTIVKNSRGSFIFSGGSYWPVTDTVVDGNEHETEE
jgi:hypothetical protein